MENRRKDKRFNAAVAAELEVGEQVHEGQTRDISVGGTSVHMDGYQQPCAPEGASIGLTLILTEDGIESALEESVSVEAEIIWVVATEDGGQMLGLRFGGLTALQTARLQRFLAAID